MENGQRKKRGRPPGPRKMTSLPEQKRAERRDEHRSGGNGTSVPQKRISNGSIPGEAEPVTQHFAA